MISLLCGVVVVTWIITCCFFNMRFRTSVTLLPFLLLLTYFCLFFLLFLSRNVFTPSREPCRWKKKNKQRGELGTRFSPLDQFPLPRPAACVIHLQTRCRLAFHTRPWLQFNPWNGDSVNPERHKVSVSPSNRLFIVISMNTKKKKTSLCNVDQ